MYGKYGPRNRLLLAGVLLALLIRSLTQLSRCLAEAWEIRLLRSFACLLVGCLLNEGAREFSSRQTITPARYDEGTLATNHNADTGEIYRSTWYTIITLLLYTPVKCSLRTYRAYLVLVFHLIEENILTLP